MASGIRVENIKEQGSVEIHLSAKQIVFKLIDINDNEISETDFHNDLLTLCLDSCRQKKTISNAHLQ